MSINAWRLDMQFRHVDGLLCDDLRSSSAAWDLFDNLAPTRVDIDPSNKKAEKSSFLKKRTKKLLSKADITIGAGW